MARNRFIDRFEFRFIIMLLIVGILVSRRPTIEFLNSLTPLQGLIIWYSMFGVFLYFLLHGFSVSIGQSQIRKWGRKETVGALILTYAFFMVWNFVESDWANFGVGNIPRILVQSEDGVFFDIYYNWLKNADLAAALTYIVTPVLLTVFAALILAPGQMKRLIK